MTTSGSPTGPRSSGGDSHEGLQAVVRALGSLLMALGANEGPPRPAASRADDAGSGAAEPAFEEARRRAYATIDRAVEDARATLATPDLQSVHARLDRLERRVDAIVAEFGVSASADRSPPEPAAPTSVAELNGDASFEPGLGSLLIAVGPVSGFQGLMRVQSAIASVDAVEEVAIEGYARSEATVRALLGATLEPERVADALRRELGQPARVRETSATERRLSIALGE